MRFMHLSDLHLGKQLNDVSLLDDQRFVLFEQIIPIAREKKVDAVLIAGDIYQRSAPQADAMELFSNFISKLSELGIKIFIISGNHDSPQRISYFSSLIRSSGVYVSESFDGKLQGISVQDDYGEIVIWMLPFLRPIYVKRKLPDQKITTYQEAVEAVLRETPIDKKIEIYLLLTSLLPAVKYQNQKSFLSEDSTI